MVRGARDLPKRGSCGSSPPFFRSLSIVWHPDASWLDAGTCPSSFSSTVRQKEQPGPGRSRSGPPAPAVVCALPWLPRPSFCRQSRPLVELRSLVCTPGAPLSVSCRSSGRCEWNRRRGTSRLRAARPGCPRDRLIKPEAPAATCLRGGHFFFFNVANGPFVMTTVFWRLSQPPSSSQGTCRPRLPTAYTCVPRRRHRSLVSVKAVGAPSLVVWAPWEKEAGTRLARLLPACPS